MNNEKTIKDLVSKINLSKVIADLKANFMLFVKGYLIPNAEDKRLFKRAEEAAKKAITAVLIESLQSKSSLSIAGYQWRLVNVHFSRYPNETDYIGTLTCNGEEIVTVINRESEGLTECVPVNNANPKKIEQILSKVKEEKWMMTKRGHELYYDFYIIADQCLSRNCYDKALTIEL